MKNYRIFLIFMSVTFSFIWKYQPKNALAQEKNPSTQNIQREIKRSFLNRNYPKIKEESDQKSKINGQFQAVDLGKRSFSPYWDRPYMLVAYALFWLVIFIYFSVVARRLGKLEEQLSALEKKLKELKKTDSQE